MGTPHQGQHGPLRSRYTARGRRCQWLQAQSGHTVDNTPQCPTHGAMQPSTKGKEWYCPHTHADGIWCKGK